MHLQSDANRGRNGGGSSSYLVILCYLMHFSRLGMFDHVSLAFDCSCYSYFMLNLCLVVASLLSLAAGLHLPLHLEDAAAPVDNNL